MQIKQFKLAQFHDFSKQVSELYFERMLRIAIQILKLQSFIELKLSRLLNGAYKSFLNMPIYLLFQKLQILSYGTLKLHFIKWTGNKMTNGIQWK